jgi:pyruvate dehydrogenase E1 component beta subunit
MFGGQASVPLVIRTPFGGGVNIAAHHSQSLEAWFMHVPGLLVVAPSTPYDAKGLLKTSIRNDNPVFFCEHKLLYPIKGAIPEETYTVPLGSARVAKEGTDITIIATMFMVNEAISAADTLEKEGVSAEVLDPRTLVPLDTDAIVNSVRKTGRAVVVCEGCKTAGVGAEIAAVIAEEAIDYLDAPLTRVAAPDTPIPFSPPLEKAVLPNKDTIIKAVRTIT